MELRSLRYFVAVADLGSVSAAVDVVRITQPALSRRIHQLERELGLRLFDRTGARLELTAAGRHFLPAAREVLRSAEAARAAADALAAGRLSHLAIAAPTTTFTDVIAPFLATFGPRDPLPTPVAPAGTEALRHGADLAIATAVPEPAWRHRALAALPLWAYVPAGHRWGARESVRLAELAAEPLIVLEPELRPRLILRDALAAAELAPEEQIVCGDAQVAQALAAAGRGVAVVSDDARFGLHGLRIEGPRGPLRIKLYAAWSPRHHAAGVLAGIAERLREFCADRYGADVLPPE
ncbi:LysR family transcriptional regulator [Saccharopolyspora sp. MS10]|uniref:LysR family transcriptional regulator n=1 Tax=Saccharopolyspora sp. MS10 TaxID=3385973 RepID=UPI00399F741B